MILIPYSGLLNGVLEKDANYLPMAQVDISRLLSIVPDGETIYLTIKDDMYEEYVLAENQCGTIVLTRGQGGTEIRKFPVGSCVKFEISLPVIQWLICNYNCCDGPCPCEAISAAGIILPEGKSGNPWEGSIVFSGDTPMEFGVTGLPSWMHADIGANYIRLYGTPLDAGTYPISAAGTNCSGGAPVIQTGTVTILN